MHNIPLIRTLGEKIVFIIRMFCFTEHFWWKPDQENCWLTLLGPLEFFIKFDTVKSGWFKIYNFKKTFFSFSQDCFVLANSADPDVMPCYVAFYLGPDCLPKFPLRGF